MRLLIFISLSFLGFGMCYGQFGQIEVDVSDNTSWSEDKVVYVELWRNSSMLARKEIDWTADFDSLTQGIYKIVVYNSKLETRLTYENISVVNDSTTYVSVCLIEDYKLCIDCDSIDDFPIGGIFGLMYSSAFDEEVPFVKNSFQFTYGVSQWYAVHKNFNIGVASIYYADLHQIDSAYKNPIGDFTKQRYFNTGIRLEGAVRLALFNTKRYWDLGPYIDLGAAYKVPFAFRHVQVAEDHRKVFNRIHNYQDFHVFCRVGYMPVSVILDYRLNDFVKNGNPQVHRLNLGVSVTPQF